MDIPEVWAWHWFALASFSCSFWCSFFSPFLTIADSVSWYFFIELSAVTLGTFWSANWERVVFPLTYYLALAEAEFHSPLHFPIILTWDLSVAEFYQFFSASSFVPYNSHYLGHVWTRWIIADLTQISWNSSLEDIFFRLHIYCIFNRCEFILRFFFWSHNK